MTSFSCVLDRRLAYLHPDYVPSLRLDDGWQLICCWPCVEAANPERERRGLPRKVIHPLAYAAQLTD
jgi:hypothetical protein